MTRHGKNCTAGAVYTYHEKKKDTGGLMESRVSLQSGYSENMSPLALYWCLVRPFLHESSPQIIFFRNTQARNCKELSVDLHGKTSEALGDPRSAAPLSTPQQHLTPEPNLTKFSLSWSQRHPVTGHKASDWAKMQSKTLIAAVCRCSPARIPWSRTSLNTCRRP